MKLKNNINIDWCIYCKEQINVKDGFVIDKKGDSYHLECYHILHTDLEPLEGNNE